MFEIGDKVRLINLPAHPGLEGQTGTVRSACEEIVDVELDLNRVVKRLKSDKLRKLITGSICELHGLVGAYKLNGQLCEVADFDSELHRYNVLLSSGVNKKVKPENIRMVGTFRSTMVTNDELKKIGTSRQSKISSLLKSGCVVPFVISGRILSDSAAIDDELSEKLLKAKQVSLETISETSQIVYVSVPRNRVVSGNHSFDLMKHFFFKLDKDAYYLLPWRYDAVGLPALARGIECSLPLIADVVDRFVLLVNPGDRVDSLRSGPQRLDMQLAAIAGKPVTVFGGSDETVALSLPSRAREYDEDQGVLLKEYEAIFGMKKNP